MTIIAVLSVQFQPDKVEEGHAELHKVLEETRAFEGSEGVDVIVDADDPTLAVCIERWASSEADAAYRDFRAGPGRPATLVPTLAGRPVRVRGSIHSGL